MKVGKGGLIRLGLEVRNHGSWRQLRSAFHRQARNFLRLAVVEESEILRLQVGNRLAMLVLRHHIDFNQAHSVSESHNGRFLGSLRPERR
jgi:hypothetical protein